MLIYVDRKIYSDKCISNAVYWLSDKYTITRCLDGDVETISASPDDVSFADDFFRSLNDFKLREIIENDTKDIRTILYAKAFGDFEGLTEDELSE